MKSIPNLSLAQISPPAAGGHNLNACHDPDCGNFGVEGHFRIHSRSASGASFGAAVGSNSRAVGLGRYKLDGTKGDEFRRVSTVFEYQRHPRKWLGGKILECQFDSGSGPCGARFELHSNEHLVEEIERLQSANGIFEGQLAAPAASPTSTRRTSLSWMGQNSAGVAVASEQRIMTTKALPDPQASA